MTTRQSALDIKRIDPRHTLPAALRRDLGRPECAPYTRQQERSAFARLQAAREAGWKIVTASRLAPRPATDQDDVALLAALSAHRVAHSPRAAALAEYRAAVADIERRNLRLVVMIAHQCAEHPGAVDMELADLVAYGCGVDGLRKAVLRFEPGKGFTFSTYGSWWIRHAIGRAIQDYGRQIRVPVHAQDAMSKVAGALARLGSVGAVAGGMSPSDEMLAAETGLSVEVVAKARAIAGGVGKRPDSLSRPVRAQQAADDVDLTVADLLPDDQAATEGDMVDGLTFGGEAGSDALARLLGCLTPVQAQVVRRRWGIGSDGDDGEILSDIGRDLGLSRERVRQIEAAALARMRSRAARLGYAPAEHARM